MQKMRTSIERNAHHRHAAKRTIH